MLELSLSFVSSEFALDNLHAFLHNGTRLSKQMTAVEARGPLVLVLGRPGAVAAQTKEPRVKSLGHLC